MLEYRLTSRGAVGRAAAACRPRPDLTTEDQARSCGGGGGGARLPLACVLLRGQIGRPSRRRGVIETLVNAPGEGSEQRRSEQQPSVAA